MLYGTNNTEYYIEKETGLVIKTIIDDTTATREYEIKKEKNSIKGFFSLKLFF